MHFVVLSGSCAELTMIVLEPQQSTDIPSSHAGWMAQRTNLTEQVLSRGFGHSPAAAVHMVPSPAAGAHKAMGSQDQALGLSWSATPKSEE